MNGSMEAANCWCFGWREGWMQWYSLLFLFPPNFLKYGSMRAKCMNNMTLANEGRMIGSLLPQFPVVILLPNNITLH